MGTIISASGICTDPVMSSITLAARAGEQCIAMAGIDRQDIDMLINIGVYRDDNIMEPAIAPLIQKRLGLNNDPLSGNMARQTFSFDLINGACGFLNAVQTADAFLSCGTAHNVLVISSDTHPSQKQTEEFPFGHIGAAVLLTHCPDEDRGFRNILYKTSGNEYQGFSAYADIARFGSTGRSCMTFVTEEGYLEKLGGMAAETVREYMARSGDGSSHLKFLLTTQQSSGFSKKIYDAAGLNSGSRPVDLYEKYGDSHTSSLSLGYHTLASEGLVMKNDRLLFVAAGSGLTSACTVYVA